MGRWRRRVAAAAAGLVVPGGAHAHHPTHDGIPWGLIAGLVVLGSFAAVWAISVVLESRRKRSEEPPPSDRAADQQPR